ncbi:MAG: hypothetical protein NXI21_03760 [Alphaproteobacteria bacterium]|nr:hypothetical protein [Alphaproteobacteria bacterium]
MGRHSKRRESFKRPAGMQEDRPRSDGIRLDAAARVRFSLGLPGGRIGGGPGRGLAALYRAAARLIGGGR